jgi:hypothetical protein
LWTTIFYPLCYLFQTLSINASLKIETNVSTDVQHESERLCYYGVMTASIEYVLKPERRDQWWGKMPPTVWRSLARGRYKTHFPPQNWRVVPVLSPDDVILPAPPLPPQGCKTALTTTATLASLSSR